MRLCLQRKRKKLVFATITGGGLFLEIYMIDWNKTAFKGMLTDPDFKTSELIFGKIEKQKAVTCGWKSQQDKIMLQRLYFQQITGTG
jgi:hypothetical protein